MQKDIKPIQEQTYYQPGNQMIYSTQQLQPIQPNLSSQQASLIQGPMQTQGRPVFSNSAEAQSIRPLGTGRMPQYGGTSYITSAYTQGQTTEVTSGFPAHSFHIQQPAQFMQNGNLQFQSYGNMNYPQRSSQFPPQPVYVVQQGNYANNVVLAPQMQSTQNHPIQNSPQQHIYPQITNVHSNQSAINLMPPPDQPSQQKKRPTIKLTDPNTGKDLTSEILSKKKEKPVTSTPAPTPDENIKAKTAALFAAQVAEKIAGSTTQPESQIEIIKTNVVKNIEESSDNSVTQDVENLDSSTSKGPIIETFDPPDIVPQFLGHEIQDSSLSSQSDKDTQDLGSEINDQSAKDKEGILEIDQNGLTPENIDTKVVQLGETELTKIFEKSNDHTEDISCFGKMETNIQEDVVEKTLDDSNIIIITELESDCLAVSSDIHEKFDTVPSIQAIQTEISEHKEIVVKSVVSDVSSCNELENMLDQDKKKEQCSEPNEKKEDVLEIIEVNNENEGVISSEVLEEEVPCVNTEFSLKKENDSEIKDTQLLKKTDKKEQIKVKDLLRKDSGIKEEVVKRFSPSFSTEESMKSMEMKIDESSKLKESLKLKEPIKNIEQMSKELKNTDSLKNSETMRKHESKRKDASEPIINGHDDSVKSVTKKKKGKSRYKDFDAKDAMNNDMLSAFVDAPVEAAPEISETIKMAEKSPEETTWEDKENIIEKEDIRGEDVEEELVVPKTVETKIIKSDDLTHDEKHQYDREFLLKFQFAPICTSKPANLPNIDIVLDEAHAPTKALIPGQRISAANDFMPTFMRQSSGGRNSTSGNRNSRDRKGGSQAGQVKPQKILHVPQFEKVELKKAENAWVRPSAQTKDMSDNEKGLFEVNRAVCSILNKLTPQKFKPLVNQMIALKIDNSAKLESAIALIFEKAISEPGFSVAYANMCRVLTDQFNKVPVSGDEGGQTVTFRKILLNKCQTEFEKETSDEKQLAVDRSKTFEKEEERKSWLAELDYREMMNRRRMLGNIRFIGELYKLKMISEPIMHDCIYKLLKAEKQDSLEDQLECLCKLLTTIGKDLDHLKAKPRMDQYFDQMEKVIEKRKISSRIKFALKDVIELRACSWVPRRDDANPKTIDQIHREAEQKEKESDIARQQDKLQRKLEPKGPRGGRDSPSVRGQPGGSSADGWNTVSNKSRQMPAATVDASKFRALKKTDTSEISLGPGGRAGAWSKGASGGGSRSGSGSNTPTSEIDSRMNRYDVLTDSSVAPSALDGKRSGSRQGLSNRKGMSNTHGSQQGSRNKTDRDEQNAATRAVRDMTGRSSRTLSPGRTSRNQSPAPSYDRDSQNQYSRQMSPKPISAEKMKKVTKSTIEEYLSCKDDKEAITCIQELQSPALYNIFIEEAITIVIEKKAEHRRIVGGLLHRMMKQGIIDVKQVCQGFTAVVDLAPDFAVDIPHIYKYVGEILGPMVYDGTLPLNKVKDTLESLIQKSKAGIVMAEALSSAVSIAGKEDLISILWQNSKVSWDMLLGSDENLQNFIKDKKMEFTLHQNKSHASQIQEEMSRILNENQNDNLNDNTELMTYIEGNVSLDMKKTASFIQILTKTICSSSLVKGNQCECNKELLRRRKNVLLRYIDRSKDLELQALFALQQLVYELKQPRDLLQVLFNELYDGDVITEDAFFTWEKSKEFPLGKGPALSSVKDFLSWLKKADEESNDEESSTSPTNVV